MGSHPPDAAGIAVLQLPFSAVALFFGADIEAGSDTVVWPDDVRQRVSEAKATLPTEERQVQLRHGLTHLGATTSSAVGRQLAHSVGRTLFHTTIVNDMARYGAYISGVVLLTDDRGGLADEMLWLVAAGPNPDIDDAAVARDRPRGVLPAYRSRAALAPLVANLAAGVAWATWRHAEGLELPPFDSRDWRHAVRTSRFRKLEPRGAAAGVRVLELGRPTSARGQSPPATHQSPTTHLRRGHWKRVRLGPRTGWHHEWRWIHEVLVNPSGRPDPGVKVYRLPTPVEALENPSDPADDRTRPIERS